MCVDAVLHQAALPGELLSTVCWRRVAGIVIVCAGALAGPAEATALGNIAMQMLATGAVGSIAEARRIIEYSFPVDRFEPEAADRWGAHYRRFQDYVEMTCV